MGKPREIEAITATDLMETQFTQVAVDKPDHAEFPTGEWYCEDVGCVVREVVVSCKLHRRKLPVMHCPACQGPLKFHHYLEHREK